VAGPVALPPVDQRESTARSLVGSLDWAASPRLAPAANEIAATSRIKHMRNLRVKYSDSSAALIFPIYSYEGFLSYYFLRGFGAFGLENRGGTGAAADPAGRAAPRAGLFATRPRHAMKAAARVTR
jgi:hypothetical protein